MRTYTQLTDTDRIEIYALLQAGNRRHQIASALGVHRSTVTRELTRLAGQSPRRPAVSTSADRRHPDPP